MIVAPSTPDWWSRLSQAWPRKARNAPGPALTHRFTMALPDGHSETVLQPHEGVRLRCKRGRLWITHDGDPKDIVLDAGQDYTAENAHDMTVHAVGDSEVEMLVSR